MTNAGAAMDPDCPPSTGPPPANDDYKIEPPVNSRRVTITRDRIIATAIEIIDANGLAGFSVRRVADQFGVATMAMYHYIHNRDDLLDSATDLLVDQLYLDTGITAAADTWKEYLTRLAQHIRTTALAHPQLALLVLSRPTRTPWLRPPLASVQWLETILDLLRRDGFDALPALAAYRSFCRFLAGHLLDITAPPITTTDRPPAHPPAIDPANYPNVHTLQAQLTTDHTTEEFDHSLNTLLDNLPAKLFDTPTQGLSR